MRGKRTPLIEAILVGSFRADRQGRLLLEEVLPEGCPVEDASEDARRAWRDLVSAQAAYRDSGAPNPWQFARLVRLFHGALKQAAAVDAFERWSILSALVIGANSRFPDELLERHWNEWASSEKEWDDPTDYAHWRFLKGLPEEEAWVEVRKARAAEREVWQIARIREFNIKASDPFFGWDMPFAERRRLILKAGRPDLIDEATCERIGLK